MDAQISAAGAVAPANPPGNPLGGGNPPTSPTGGGTGAVVELKSPIKTCDPNTDPNCNPLGELVKNVVNFIFGLAVLICPIFIIWGGFEIATAAGSDEKVRNGKNMITYALVGLVVIALSSALANAITGLMSSSNP